MNRLYVTHVFRCFLRALITWYGTILLMVAGTTNLVGGLGAAVYLTFCAALLGGLGEALLSPLSNTTYQMFWRWVDQVDKEARELIQTQQRAEQQDGQLSRVD